jgi:hypothetical protein
MDAAAGAASQTLPKFDVAQVPGVIGAELARHSAAIDKVLHTFRKTKAITRSQMDTLRHASAAVQRIARQSQQLSRLAAGRVRQSHERLSLDNLLRHVLKENDYRYYEAGVVFDQHIQPVDVILDPGLLVSLLEVAVDCAASHGQVVSMFLSIKNWPEHGVLKLQARQHVAGGSGAAAEDSLEWVMLLQLAEATGVLVERKHFDDHMLLAIEFPRTVRQLEGLSAVELDAGGDSSFSGESRPLAGHRILLVTSDARLRMEVEHVCSLMRLVVDVTPTSRQAVRRCELDKPDMIIVDEQLHDDDFDQLREDLLRYDVNFPFIEIAAEPNVVEMSSWMGDSMSRISREALQSQLPSMLTMELAKVF